MNAPAPSRWRELFCQAMSIIDQANAHGQIVDRWTFGGGTALMLQIGHRESRDIDLFIPDPQVLPFLNPETQSYSLDLSPSDYETDGSTTLKIVFDGIGEIDFICGGTLTTPATTQTIVESRSVALETPTEIIAKKIYYRGGRMQPRDMFDIAAVIQNRGATELVEALVPHRDRCETALGVVRRMDPDFARTIMAQLMIRPAFQELCSGAQKTTERFLEGVVSHG